MAHCALASFRPTSELVLPPAASPSAVASREAILVDRCHVVEGVARRGYLSSRESQGSLIISLIDAMLRVP